MIDLREEDRRAIVALADRLFSKGTEIWAYGSRVKGTHHDASDLDLVVRFPRSENTLKNAAQLEGFLEALRDSNIPIVVQALPWHAIPEHFKANIRACYQVLWPVTSDDCE